LRHRWKYHRPSRFDVGAPLPQTGFKAAGSEGGGSESGVHNLQGMPLDYFPTPLDPPTYATEKMEDGVIER
jgi:hypothetical protein